MQMHVKSVQHKLDQSLGAQSTNELFISMGFVQQNFMLDCIVFPTIVLLGISIIIGLTRFAKNNNI